MRWSASFSVWVAHICASRDSARAAPSKAKAAAIAKSETAASSRAGRVPRTNITPPPKLPVQGKYEVQQRVVQALGHKSLICSESLALADPLVGRFGRGGHSVRHFRPGVGGKAHEYEHRQRRNDRYRQECGRKIARLKRPV